MFLCYLQVWRCWYHIILQLAVIWLLLMVNSKFKCSPRQAERWIWSMAWNSLHLESLCISIAEAYDYGWILLFTFEMLRLKLSRRWATEGQRTVVGRTCGGRVLMQSYLKIHKERLSLCSLYSIINEIYGSRNLQIQFVVAFKSEWQERNINDDKIMSCTVGQFWTLACLLHPDLYITYITVSCRTTLKCAQWMITWSDLNSQRVWHTLWVLQGVAYPWSQSYECHRLQ